MKNYAREIWNFYGSWKFVLMKFKNFETRLIPKSFFLQNIIHLDAFSKDYSEISFCQLSWPFLR